MIERFTVTVAGRPVPAARMTTNQVRRLRSGKALDNSQITRYLAYKDAVGLAAKLQGATPMDGRLWVRMWIYLDKRGRGDIDNFAKAVLDGLKQVAWADDAQVDELIVRIRTGYENEHVDVEIWRT